MKKAKIVTLPVKKKIGKIENGKDGKLKAVIFDRAMPGWIRAEDRADYAALSDEKREMLDKRKLMYEDGAPLALLTRTAEERKQGWVDNPPAPLPRFDAPQRQEDPSTTAFRKELEDKAAAEASRKSAKALRSPKEARPSREGLTTVASIALEYGLIPRLARAALRAAKIAKPPQGWAFAAGSEDEKKIRAALAAAKDTTTTPRAKGDPRAPKKSRSKIKVENAVWSGTPQERRKWQKLHAKRQSATSVESAPISSAASGGSKTKPSKRGKQSSKQSTSSTAKTKANTGAARSATKPAKSSPKQSAKKHKGR